MNSGLLTGVNESEIFLYRHFNAGKTSTKLKEDYGSVDCCLEEEWIANIFSIHVLKNLCLCITYNSNVNHWCVSKDNITVNFKWDEQGLT